jgi:hypothetical protein
MKQTGRPGTAQVVRHGAISVMLLLCLCLAADYARATVGMAEYAWYFHHQPGRWIEWHHGDICPPESPRKECVFVRPARAAERRSGSHEPVPYHDFAQGLYLTTVLALLPLAVGLAGLARLWRLWRKRAVNPGGSSLRSTWVLSLVTVLAGASVPRALAVLFPATPSADGWGVVIFLSFNIFIALAPLTLWWSYRRLFPPPGRPRLKGWARLPEWLLLLLSSVLAPPLLWGPPNLLMFLFPPLMLPNIVASLLVVWLASKGYDALNRRTSNR